VTRTSATAGDDAARALAAFCDTIVPPAPGEPAALIARSATEAGVIGHLALDAGELIVTTLGRDFADGDEPSRTRKLVHRMGIDDAAAGALRRLRAQVLALFYGLAENGRNPTWDAIGYPGPITAPPTPDERPKRIPVIVPRSSQEVISADACVVGTGAGGAVIACRLQQAGLSVVVLEQGGYTSESDLRQEELHDAARTYLRGGLFWSESGSIGILAGGTLGGGTFVNSLVCLRLPDDVRSDWAAAGLDGLNGPEFDRFQDAVWERLGVNVDATVPNASNELMAAALAATGRTWQLLPRNAGPHDPQLCGYCNGGCQQGEKQSTLLTYLQDAADFGARLLVDCRAERVLVRDGRAAGVSAVWRGHNGAMDDVSVRAPIVVVAGGAVESPALLLRSGIGGPAVGRNLKLHPAWFMGGVHDERLDAWTGQIQSVTSPDFRLLPHGGGFLPECVILSPTFWSSAMPWRGGAEHKRQMLDLCRTASWHAVTRDRGSGRVVLSADGEAVVQWKLSDARDLETATIANVELARLHEAAGAKRIFTFDPPGLTWQRDEEPFGSFLDRLRAVDWSRAVPYSAHQMCSCRMGTDPTTSVADVRGELHDVRGVWVGDASALPDAPGINPMIAIMALAERTASRIIEDRQSAC
jgi:choline dehydrogenase-like flavoprotein